MIRTTDTTEETCSCGEHGEVSLGMAIDLVTVAVPFATLREAIELFLDLHIEKPCDPIEHPEICVVSATRKHRHRSQLDT